MIEIQELFVILIVVMGIIGMVRGFFYAGAKRVVASLWKVDDEATSELMQRFYVEMLQAYRGARRA